MDEEKNYADDVLKTIKGFAIFFVVALTIWGILALLGYNDEPEPAVKRDPTQAEIDAWNRESGDCANSDTGCEWDNRWGQ